jgi:tRNA nucleotidyltransferase (CCA-adding enzyme)
MFDIRTIPGAEKLNDAFSAAGFELRLVGGAVRDILLGETPKDFDFATDATPDEMRTVANKADFGCVATGEAHGTMTIVVDGEPFEVTTLRIDVETDGRRAEVEFTRSFEEDAARRDLTFNAMSMCFDGKLYDYFGGQQDLEGRIVRFVGDARQRVEEDYLRILRYFRFAARFNAMPEPGVLEMFMDPAIQAGLRKISVERYWLEMSKLFMAPGAVVTLSLMENFKVLETIGIPGPLVEGRFTWADDPAAKLSTFIPNTKGDDKIAQEFCRDWKLSRDIMDKVVWLVRQRDASFSEPAVEDLLVDGVPRDWVVSWALIAGNDDGWARRFDPPKFPVNGQDLMDLGVAPGPAMGAILKTLRDTWKSTRFEATKEQLLASLERV